MAKYKRYKAGKDMPPTVLNSNEDRLTKMQEELPEAEGLTAKELASLKKKGRKSARAKKLARKAVE